MALRFAVRDLTVVYPAPDGGELPALGPVTLEVEPGAFVCLVGPSGCGKSTLIRVLAGLQPPTTGSAWMQDAPITGPSRRVGLMFQSPSLMPWRTVEENIALPLELAGVSKPERAQAVRSWLPALGLAEFGQAYPGELSGGMAQRAALGRVLVQEPDALLLDEPFGALDALTREQVSLDLMRVWERKRQTVIMVTHSIQEAVLLADRIVVFSRRPGRILADFDVPLPRPRSLNDVYQDAFAAVARAVRAAIDRA